MFPSVFEVVDFAKGHSLYIVVFSIAEVNLYNDGKIQPIDYIFYVI